VSAPLDDGVRNLDELCALLRGAVDQLAAAAGALEVDPGLLQAHEAAETELTGAVAAVLQRQEQAGHDLGEAVAAVQDCEAECGTHVPMGVGAVQSELDALAARLQGSFAAWEPRPPACTEDLATGGFLPARTALEDLEAAAHGVSDALHATGQALEEAAARAREQLERSMEYVRMHLDATAAAADGMLGDLEALDWRQRWRTVGRDLHQACHDAREALTASYGDWLSDVEARLTAAEQATREAAEAAAQVMDSAGQELEARQEARRESQQAFASLVAGLAEEVSGHAAQGEDLAAASPDLSVALSVADTVEALLKAMDNP
jgi:hypothetical protein